MSDTSIPDSRLEAGSRAASAGGSVGDYFALMKPRVMSLVVFTALTGLVAAPGSLHPVLAGIAILCIAVGAGASGALNMWYDADIDARMARTATRPIPGGRVTGEEAFTFGIVLSIGSVLILGLLVNWAAGALLALTIAFYVLVYTMWLKRWTSQNIVIGGAAGAFPPMIGWASVTGTVSVESIVLFLIIFMWTPPHFWALALLKSEDYARAGVPMLPVVSGESTTRSQILIYSIALAPIGIAPWLIGLGGTAYGIIALVMTALFLALAVQIRVARDPATIKVTARRLFAFSILYLFVLYATLLVERLVHML